MENVLIMALYNTIILLDLNPPLGTSHTEKEYAHLNKATMEGKPYF